MAAISTPERRPGSLVIFVSFVQQRSGKDLGIVAIKSSQRGGEHDCELEDGTSEIEGQIQTGIVH